MENSADGCKKQTKEMSTCVIPSDFLHGDRFVGCKDLVVVQGAELNHTSPWAQLWPGVWVPGTADGAGARPCGAALKSGPLCSVFQMLRWVAGGSPSLADEICLVVALGSPGRTCRAGDEACVGIINISDRCLPRSLSS